MHTLNIMANRLQQRHEEAGIRKVVLAVYRAGSFISVPILIKRTLLQADEVMGILDEGQQEGLLTVEAEDGRRTIARLTEKGTEQASVWKQEGDERTAEFLSTLSDEEKEELDRLGRKLLNMTVKRR
jgi:DNA-binding MarR family transcriptional regulator